MRMDEQPIIPLLDWSEHVLAPLGQAPAKHHRALLSELAGLAEGRFDRLMVLMPPGSAKSTYASVIFPAWWFHRYPASSVIAACHTADLADHFGRQVRDLAAEHAGRLGYGVSASSRAAGRWRTTGKGEYFAAGVRGPITGRRADLVLIDDPVKSHFEADSALHRDQLWDWYRSELITRLKPRGRVALIMTRWHQDDLGGRLLGQADGWHVVRLPALAEPGDPLGRVPGAALWPEWEDAAALERKRATVGSRVWAALYQQAPTPPGGALFPADRVAIVDDAAREMPRARAWDLAATAATQGRDPDWTVGLLLGREPGGRFVVLDVVRLRGGPHEVEQAICAAAGRDGQAVPIGLPQDPGQAGKQQVAWLSSRLAGYRVIASPETGAKLTRAMPVAAQAEAGNLAVLRARWNGDFIEELRDFPLGRKDDQVDALSRAFAMLLDRSPPARRLALPLMIR
jgi:predicted phage terminase large subunit-like protein